jgi:hypothetical protein
VAAEVEAVETKAVKADKVEEVAIKARANIEVKDTVIEVKEEVTIALIIGHYH